MAFYMIHVDQLPVAYRRVEKDGEMSEMTAVDSRSHLLTPSKSILIFQMGGNHLSPVQGTRISLTHT